MGGHGGRRVGEPAHHHAVVHELLAGLGQLAVPARVGGHVDHHRSLGHALDHGRGHEDGGPAPGTAAVVMTTSAGRHLVADQLALAGQELLGLLAGVAAGPLLGLEPELDEVGAEPLDLLLGRGPHVVGLHLGTEPSGGGDGLQAGHTDAHAPAPWREGRCPPPS